MAKSFGDIGGGHFPSPPPTLKDQNKPSLDRGKENFYVAILSNFCFKLSTMEN